jgi:alkyldihydroxyacetonephosphate synthase
MSARRERSHWGWGWADKWLDRDARAGMGAQVGAMLGFEGLSPEEPAPLDAIELAAPRVDAPEIDAPITAEPAARIRHTYGKSYRDLVRGFAGDYGAAPDLVALPESEEQVARILAWASEARVAVIPFGGGTSVVGGVEAALDRDHRAVLSLDLTRMDRVLEIEESSMSARIQAGARGPRLEEQLAERGLTLRFFPQSFEHSTLGGWIATRAGGHFATVYTHIDDLTLATRTLTPRGPMETRRLPGSGAGPSPDRMVLGSEGTLGVITEGWMQIRPRPTFRATASVRFDDYDKAVHAVRALSQSGLHPSNCRLLDSREAALSFVANDGSSVLVLGFESADHPLEPWMERALELAEDHGGECPDGATYGTAGEKASGGAAGTWKQAFIEAPYLQNTMVSLGVIADTFETAIPWDRFEALHTAVIRNVRDAMKRACGRGSISCRFTHVYPSGPAPYYTFLAPARRGAELEQWAEIKKAASDTLIAHGATITHHHAVGRTHKPWYEAQRPALFGDALAAAKRTLDPKGVMNPGCLI